MRVGRNSGGENVLPNLDGSTVTVDRVTISLKEMTRFEALEKMP